MRSILPLLLAAATLLGPAATAQFPAEVRYDLGQRLRRFENAWAATTGIDDPALQQRRGAARQAMQAAVTAFFSMNPSKVAEQVDAAWLELVAGDDAAQAAELQRLLSATLRVSYAEVPPGAPWAAAASHGHLFRADAPQVTAIAGVAPELLPPLGWFTVAGRAAAQRTAPIGPAASASDAASPEADGTNRSRPGDVEIGLWQLDDAGAPLRDLGRRMVSNLDAADLATLAELRSRDIDRSDGPLRCESESLFGLQRLFETLCAGECYETDVPACHLLDRARLLTRHLDDQTPLRLDDHPGEHWLRLPIGVRAAAVRLHVPEPSADSDTPPPPLVLALHGMGGSEHLFFDGYGDGLAVRLAAARGWPLCAPRTLTAAGVGPLLDALATRLRFDPERVYVIGHSMGAGTAVGAVAKFPGRLQAVAALGGGGRVGDDDAARATRFLVLPGEFDFALSGARRLAAELEDAGAPCRFRVVPGVEHMLVVQEALPEVFAWLDD